jgi:anaerobic ribonucleoside-triphosphate reductase activating protein
MIRLASELQTDSIVDGNGIRTVIWTQGCAHRCPGCHNPNTHDFNGGMEKDLNELKTELSSLEFQDGVTFSGGDPFFQPAVCAELAEHVQSLGMNVWCYTGYKFEQLLKLSHVDAAIMKFLENIDVMIDGPFMIAKRSYSLKFRGSSNQRIIDVKASLSQGKTVLLELTDAEFSSNFGRHEQLIYI